jgi:hypothetical protein
MSYKHVGTAGDLVRFGCSLKVECTHCGAAQTVDGIDVHRVHGNQQLAQLAPRLKCTRCGAQGGEADRARPRLAR